jgi:hypothetical protein
LGEPQRQKVKASLVVDGRLPPFTRPPHA